MSIDYMNRRKVLGPEPDTNRNQDAIDILDRARQQVSYFDYATFLVLLHAADYLWRQGRMS